MGIKISDERLSVVKLSNIHNLKDFNCGDSPEQKELSDFLKEDALAYQENDLAITYLCVLDNQAIVGYITLCSNSVKFSDEELSYLIIDDLELREIPALKIARLAVEKKFQTQGIGKYIVFSAFKKAREIKGHIGLRIVTVDSKKESISYYENKFGFKKLENYAKRGHPCLYIDMNKI